MDAAGDVAGEWVLAECFGLGVWGRWGTAAHASLHRRVDNGVLDTQILGKLFELQIKVF